MAHMIEDSRMAYVGQVPWHGIGTRIKDTATVDEFITAAQLNTTVEKRPLFLADGRPVSHYATVRCEDNKILGTVGPKYEVLQNIDAFRFFQRFLDAGTASLHTAGSLCGGSRIWVLAHVKQSQTDIVPGDRVDSFILLSHAHDGSMCVRCGFTPIRVVCANTLAQAHADSASSKLLRIRHTSSMHETLERIGEIMDLARSEFVASVEQYRFLASKQVNAADLRKYVRRVFNAPENDEDVSTKMQNIMEDAIARAESGLGTEIPTVRGSYWGAYNAISEALAWRGKDAGKRLNSLWFGTNAEANKSALAIALEMSS